MTEEAEKRAQDMQLMQLLVDKGYTPHAKPVPMATGLETWWEKQTNEFSWPMTVTIIGFLVFILLMTHGVPW